MPPKYAQSGVALVSCLIFLVIVTGLVFEAMENSLLNQKMNAAFQAQVIAFNSAEAGLIAEEAQINGTNVTLSDIPGTLEHYISQDTEDNCQQHILTIISKAHYQKAEVQLRSGYLKAKNPPISGCSANQISHRLWWEEETS